jgi:hypothetical protein
MSKGKEQQANYLNKIIISLAALFVDTSGLVCAFTLPCGLNGRKFFFHYRDSGADFSAMEALVVFKTLLRAFFCNLLGTAIVPAA